MVVHAAIQEDVRKLLSQRPPSEVSQKAHPTNLTNPYGNVTQHSLLNGSGRTEDTTTDHDLRTDGKQFSAPECQALGRLQAAFFRSSNCCTKFGGSSSAAAISNGVFVLSSPCIDDRSA